LSDRVGVKLGATVGSGFTTAVESFRAVMESFAFEMLGREQLDKTNPVIPRMMKRVKANGYFFCIEVCPIYLKLCDCPLDNVVEQPFVPWSSELSKHRLNGFDEIRVTNG
jgi:hypothetical protein